ncbi:MAG: stage II sporulation protein P [bacterium]|nr:stage II sporulation protein P [bacterium]MDY4099006.1 stage II sporulation protein P [Lachnospiraceae bacterium]
MQAWVETKKYRKRRRIGAAFILLFCVCAAFFTGFLQLRESGETKTNTFASYAGIKARESIYQNVIDYYMPILSAEKPVERTISQLLTDAVLGCFPVYTYAAGSNRTASTESAFEAELEQQLAEELQEENEAWHMEEKETDSSEQDFFNQQSEEQFYAWMQGNDTAGSVEYSLFSYATKKAQKLDLEELTDYQTLVKKHYRIDGTTGSNSSQLNLKKLLKKNMKLTEDVEGPQILIYHTHSLEGYRDSEEGNLDESVVGLGDYLTEILTQRYGFQVLHDRSTYDSDRDRAYGVAGPYLQKILKDHPTIEVVIDLHRDGVGKDTYLLTEVNDTVMAPIMFFNGLSYTNKNGALTSLKNPNLQTNLAFSLQMELIASEYYPGLSRGIYLKGLRYNMHYCPKSLLVEVGAQTNSLQEAMNAMPPLADVLNRVLSGEKP